MFGGTNKTEEQSKETTEYLNDLFVKHFAQQNRNNTQTNEKQLSDNYSNVHEEKHDEENSFTGKIGRTFNDFSGFCIDILHQDTLINSLVEFFKNWVKNNEVTLDNYKIKLNPIPDEVNAYFLFIRLLAVESLLDDNGDFDEKIHQKLINAINNENFTNSLHIKNNEINHKNIKPEILKGIILSAMTNLLGCETAIAKKLYSQNDQDLLVQQVFNFITNENLQQFEKDNAIVNKNFRDGLYQDLLNLIDKDKLKSIPEFKEAILDFIFNKNNRCDNNTKINLYKDKIDLAKKTNPLHKIDNLKNNIKFTQFYAGNNDDSFIQDTKRKVICESSLLLNQNGVKEKLINAHSQSPASGFKNLIQPILSNLLETFDLSPFSSLNISTTDQSTYIYEEEGEIYLKSIIKNPSITIPSINNNNSIDIGHINGTICLCYKLEENKENQYGYAFQSLESDNLNVINLLNNENPSLDDINKCCQQPLDIKKVLQNEINAAKTANKNKNDLYNEKNQIYQQVESLNNSDSTTHEERLEYIKAVNKTKALTFNSSQKDLSEYQEMATSFQPTKKDKRRKILGGLMLTLGILVVVGSIVAAALTCGLAAPVSALTIGLFGAPMLAGGLAAVRGGYCLFDPNKDRHNLGKKMQSHIDEVKQNKNKKKK